MTFEQMRRIIAVRSEEPQGALPSTLEATYRKVPHTVFCTVRL